MADRPSPTTTNNPPGPRDSDRHLSVALHHANLLQQRKDIESSIFDALEQLIDYPLSKNASASSPSSEDLSTLQTLIQPFQISDYDSLLEERNITGKCAYVLCPRPFAKDARQRGKVQFVKIGKRGDVKAVPREEVRKWCSQECARRAMFVKVQLSEVPAWERAGGLGKKIEVLEEGDEEALERRMGQLDMAGDEDEEMNDADSGLALERGDVKNSVRQKELLKKDIVENSVARPSKPPDHSDAGASDGYSIEGYVPNTEMHDSKDEDYDSDWELM